MKIRIADYTDKNDILEFIDMHWQKGHIFVQWPELFDEYHKNGDKLNYVIAIDEETRKIYGVCGFIYANHEEKPDVWLALWKVIPSGIPSLGMDIVRYLHNKLNCNILACCGIKKEVKRLYEFLGYKTGTLRHYYKLNDSARYSISNIHNIPKKIDIQGEGKLIEIKTEIQFQDMINYELKDFHTYSPYRDIDYILKKYFHNISYQYRIWGIQTAGEEIRAIVVTKVVEVNSKKALRIVDFYGNETELSECGKAFDNLLKNENYEYVDFYQYGLSERTMEKLGMILRKEEDENIIPNYFEPYMSQNVNIHFFTSKMEKFRMFKADGDQERPNCMQRMKG